MRYLYKIPQGIGKLRKYTKSDPKVDHSECALMGVGQMTVLPPSRHKNGEIYKWIDGHSPEDMEIALAPNWMVGLMKKEEQPPGPEQTIQSLENQCVRFEKDWSLQQSIGLSENEWFTWSSLLISAGHMDAAELFSKSSHKHDVRSENRLIELREEQREAMVRCSTLGCNSMQIEKCFKSNIRKNKSGEITNSPGAFILNKNKQKNSNLPSRSQLDKIGFIFSDKSKYPIGLNENKFARHVLQKMDLLYFGPGERFYNYEYGCWKSNDYNSIARKIRTLLHENVPDFWSLKLEKGYMEALMREAHRVEKLDSKRDYLNLENGMLNLNNFALENHNKDFHSTIRLPITFSKNAKCPNFLKFLNSTFDGDEELIDLISQIFGYCLTADIKGQKAFIFYGKGSNGKSVLIDVLTKLCGKENVSAISLKELDNSFSRYELVDKLVNLSTENEVGSGELNTQYFKAIVSGDPIRVEKKHETGFMYEPICKLVFPLYALLIHGLLNSFLQV
jgi:hypothetical protein